MMPAKVNLQEVWSAPSRNPNVAKSVQPSYAPAGKGKWADAVMNGTPYLSKQGVQEALGILDLAIGFSQQAKALDSIICDAQQNRYSPDWHCAAAMMQAQVHMRQQQLLDTFQTLCYGGDALPGWPSVPGNLATSLGTGPPLGAEASSHDWTQPLPQQAPTRHHDDKSQINADTRPVQTLSASLRLLSTEDPNCLFIVRRINKLGFKAACLLKRHFAHYGGVVRILVAHSTVRPQSDPFCHARRRPASLGFVQMIKPEAVRFILALGEEQIVNGYVIRVQKFQRHNGETADENRTEENDDQPSSEGLESTWEPQKTCHSVASTATASTSASSSERNAQSTDSGDSEGVCDSHN